MVGSIIVFANARDQRWGRVGILVAVPILITFAPFPFNALSSAPLPIDPTVLGVLLCAPMLLIMGALVLGRGGAIGMAVVLGAIQAVLWWFSSWATVAYAASVGLPLRDGRGHENPALPGLIPMFLIIAALAVEGAILLSHTRRIHFGRLMLPLGALAGLIVGVTFALQFALTNNEQPSVLLILILSISGLVLGIPAGYLGTRFGTILRTADTAGKVAA
jgi:hypothetical protein